MIHARLQHLPTYVYVLFCGLVYIGVTHTRSMPGALLEIALVPDNRRIIPTERISRGCQGCLKNTKFMVLTTMRWNITRLTMAITVRRASRC
ncbi:hypothetical protein BDI4_1330010 [Burkholderia diffusa]|nr:hypothetical protein BDI4_1330010 [Burkholderia diffusa]